MQIATPRVPPRVPPPAPETPQDLARQLLQQAQEGAVDVGVMEALARAVLQQPGPRLARQVRRGGPFQVRRALELAVHVLGEAQQSGVRSPLRRKI